jgi:perosamine synthetase
MTTSGTTALTLALMTLNLKPGDEIIVPNYTMIATVNAVKLNGATPVLVDVDPDTFTLSPEIVDANITANTKAVMHVSLNNRCKDLKNLAQLCDERKLVLIEDSAQSLGCVYQGKHLGTYGKIGCFSLSTPKIISTGQGGFCVTDDDDTATTLRMMKNFGRRTSGNDEYACVGSNFKFTDLQAVIGLEQLKKLPQRVSRMRDMYNLYYSKLSDIMKPPCFQGWIPWFVDIKCHDREGLIKYLKQNGVQTRPVYPQLNRTEMYNDGKDTPVSKHVCENWLFLPSHTFLTDEDILRVCRLILHHYHQRGYI